MEKRGMEEIIFPNQIRMHRRLRGMSMQELADHLGVSLSAISKIEKGYRRLNQEQLIQVGINSVDELKKVGAKAAWLKIQEIDESACINRLMALEGAIEGVKKTMLSDEVKADLKEFYQWSKK